MNIPKLPVQILAAAGAMLLTVGILLLLRQRAADSAGPVEGVLQPLSASASRPAKPAEPARRGPPDTVPQSPAGGSVAPASGAGVEVDNAIRRAIDRMNSQALREAPAGTIYLAESEPGHEGRNGSIAMNGRSMGRGLSAVELIATAYGTSRSRLRLADGVRLPSTRFDYLVSIDSDSASKEALQDLLRQKLGLTAFLEQREEEVYVLRARQGEFENRRPSEDASGGTRVSRNDGELTLQNASIGALVRNLEPVLPLPVVDESGLRGRFDIVLTLAAPPDGEKPAPEIVRKVVSEQLGLELQAEKRELEVLRVEPVKKG